VSTILNIFPKSKLTKLANLVQLKRMLMFCLEDWGRGLLPPPLWLRHWHYGVFLSIKARMERSN